jgi:hypothetical protein
VEHSNGLCKCKPASLNIFGTAGTLPNLNTHNGKKERPRRRVGDNHEGEFGEEGETRMGLIGNYFSKCNDEKRTDMRMSFVGDGYLLTLLM